MRFGTRIRAIRARRRSDDPEFSVRKVARRIGVEPSYLSKVERNLVPPPSEATIRKLARVLGEDPDDLLAAGGKVSTELCDIIRRRPLLIGALLRQVREAPDIAVKRAIGEVRDNALASLQFESRGKNMMIRDVGGDDLGARSMYARWADDDSYGDAGLAPIDEELPLPTQAISLAIHREENEPWNRYMRLPEGDAEARGEWERWFRDWLKDWPARKEQIKAELARDAARRRERRERAAETRRPRHRPRPPSSTERRRKK